MSATRLPVEDKATREIIGDVPVARHAEIDAAVSAASAAFASWSNVPVVERARLLFRYADALERRHSDLALSVSRENGKTLPDARAEVRRGIEAVEFACGMPSLMMGDALADVARGIDSVSMRYPLGVCVGITPFNFPAMIPLWMFPLAIAAGNTFVLKPSPQTPLTSQLLESIARESGFPDGVLTVVHGGVETSEALIDHPGVAAVSFVGSSNAARRVQERAVRAHKRVQALGGAKNYLIVMPDAAESATCDAVIGAAFGGAGQRCLAGSVLITVGKAADWLIPRVVEAATSLRLGPGTESDVDMGPVVSDEAIARIRGYVERARAAGIDVLLDAGACPGPGKFLRAGDFRPRRSRRRACARRDFRPGAGRRARRIVGARHLYRQRLALRQRFVDFHARRWSGAYLRFANRSWDGRHQRRRRRTNGVFSLRRREGFDLRRPALPRQGCRRVLHAAASRD